MSDRSSIHLEAVSCVPLSMIIENKAVPRNGIQGGFAAWSFSRYWPKFFVLAINCRIDSRVALVLGLTCAHVRLSLRIGAVPRADTMDVRVEKLFIMRHFCSTLARYKTSSTLSTHICYANKVFDDHHSLLDFSLLQNHLGNPIRQLIRVEDQRFHIGSVCLCVLILWLLLPCFV
jgi:hypothetical protein